MPPSRGLQSLRAGARTSRLGGRALFYYGIAAATPLTVIIGGISLGFGQVRQLATPVGYLAAAGVLAVFVVGLAAMARHVPNPGAFYSYIAAGLGKPAAAGAALVALLAYTTMQTGLYGAFGPAVAAAVHGQRPAAEEGPAAGWGMWALLGWAAILLLGQLRLRTNAIILGVLITAEIGYVLVIDLVLLAHPADGIWRFDALNPALLANPAGVASLVGAITGLIGFEVPLAFALLAVDPRSTVRRAIQAILIVVAVLYGGSALVMSTTAGPDQIIDVAAQHPRDLFFYLAAPHVPAAVIHAGMVLYATSLFAAMLAFTSTVSRYTLTLAREKFLPRQLAITRADEVPIAAGLLQSGITLAVLVIVVLAGADPTLDLFFFGTVSGGLGVLILMALASIAVIRFFRARPNLETWARRRLAPITAAILLTIITLVSVAFFGDLLGATDPVTTWITPLTYAAVFVAGVIWCRLLKTRRPQVYQALGLGAADPALGAAISLPAAITAPQQRRAARFPVNHP